MREPHYLGEDYSESIIEVMKHFGAKRYCLIGGMYDVVPHTRDLLVSGSGTSPEPEGRMEQLGVRSSRYEGPTTITYMVTQETERMGMQNMTLIARLPQYVQLEEDHAGTAKLIELLSSFYPIPSELVDADKGPTPVPGTHRRRRPEPRSQAGAESTRSPVRFPRSILRHHG